MITLLAFAFVGFYGAGSFYNRHISNKMLKIVWKKLRKYNVEGELISLGSSGFIITLNKPTRYFNSLAVSMVLGKREFPINWLIDFLRGKRDTLNIKVVLKRRPPINIEIFRGNNYYGKILSKKLGIRISEDIIIIPNINYKFSEYIKRTMIKEKDIWWVSIREKGIHLSINCNARLIYTLDKVLKMIENVNALLELNRGS